MRILLNSLIWSALYLVALGLCSSCTQAKPLAIQQRNNNSPGTVHTPSTSNSSSSLTPIPTPISPTTGNDQGQSVPNLPLLVSDDSGTKVELQPAFNKVWETLAYLNSKLIAFSVHFSNRGGIEVLDADNNGTHSPVACNTVGSFPFRHTAESTGAAILRQDGKISLPAGWWNIQATVRLKPGGTDCNASNIPCDPYPNSSLQIGIGKSGRVLKWGALARNYAYGQCASVSYFVKSNGENFEVFTLYGNCTREGTAEGGPTETWLQVTSAGARPPGT